MLTFSCFQCSHKCSKPQMLIIHIKIMHPFVQKLECLSQNCHRIFSNISSFKKHLLSQHKDLSESPISESVLQEVIPEVTNSSSRSEIVIEDLKYNSESEVYNYSFSGDMRKQILAFIANLYSISSLPRNIVQKVMDGLTELLLTMIAGISETAKNMENGLPEKLVEAFHDIQDILSSLRSEFKRFKYFESSESFIKPKTFLIGERIVADKSGIPNQSALNIKKAEGQLIPLSKVLQKFLELPNVYDTITDYMNKQMTAPPTYLCSIFQGSLWKNIRSQFDVNKILFPIFLYFDDFESCNPLGSKAGLHKIGAVYISLACIPPEYATLLENIHMGQLFYSDDRSFYGNQKIFSKLLNDLYKLEIEGISITKNSKKVNIHFVVLLILGDNLGMNSILGFQESFQSTYFCRICRTSKEDSKTQTLENYTTLRSPENYVDDSEELSHGIKETCIFHKLPSFHVTENISVDLMHDVLEGILRYDLARILNYLIGKKYFNLELLNNRIKFFDFSEIDLGNTVPLIKHESLKKNYIVLSASEMLSFVAFLGILIGDLVPEDDDCWILYINLHQIMQILLSRTITLDTVEHLQMLIEEHHSIYCELFNDTLKPKHHFLLHYPGIIKKVGPPRYFWAMRYEACHKILKSTADAVTSRKNILFTIALKFQLRFSYRLISERGISLDISYGHCDDIHSFTNFDEFKQLFDSIGVCLYSNNSFCTSWIKINNIIYKCGVVVHVSDIEYPQFGIIHNILSVNSSIYFIVQPLKTVGLNFHLQAYEVEFLPRRRIKEMILTLVDNLIDKMPSNIHYSGNGLKVIGIL